jgi:glutamate dehydrogenase
MIFKDGKPSKFYQTYVKEIQKIIQENAAMEFACIWAEYSKHDGTKARTLISDELSSTLNNLQAKLEGSDLFDDASTRQAVMKRAMPKTLIDQVGLDTLLKRVPEAHQRALFSSWIAAHFVSFSVLLSFLAHD